MPLDNRNTSNYWHEEFPKCPWCDYVIDINKHEMFELYDTQEGDHTVECPHCDKELLVRVHCSFTFSTDEQEESVS